MEEDASTQPTFSKQVGKGANTLTLSKQVGKGANTLTLSKQVGKEKYFTIGFFAFIFILLAAGFIEYFILVKGGASQDVLTVVWGGLIFLFAFIGIVAISLVVKHIQEQKKR